MYCLAMRTPRNTDHPSSDSAIGIGVISLAVDHFRAHFVPVNSRAKTAYWYKIGPEVVPMYTFTYDISVINS